VAKWIDPTFSLLEALGANSFWCSHLKNLWRILCESFSSSKMVRLASIFTWNILLNPDKVAFACSEDKATLESDLSAAAGGGPMGRGQLLRPPLS
jgi:hypothetical protein